MLTRRATGQLFAAAAAAAALGHGTSAIAAEQVVKVGINLPLTGADAESAVRIQHAIQLAFDDANAANAVPGYRFETASFDAGTATAGQYDPAQAATNARKMVSDPRIVAAVGPIMSGSGKAMSPILSEGSLATITPASTNPDITSAKFAAQYRPQGKAVYFRTVTTDAFQGPNLANYIVDKLHVKTMYILDDSGAFGVGIADSFQQQAAKKGVKILGRDRLDPKAADYTAVLTKIKSMNPDAMFYGGVAQAGVKLAKQAYDIIPNVIKAGGDGMMSPELLTAAGFPAAEGWYATQAAPHVVGDSKAEKFVAHYRSKYGMSPDDYSITAYDAGLVIVDSVKRLVEAKKPITKANMRDAIQEAKVPTIQGVVQFDDNGDIKDRTVSVYQVHKDMTKPLDDVSAQYKYMGVAPQS